MTLTIGTGNGAVALSDGTRAQPWRLVTGTGRRLVETVPLVRSADAALLDRKNRSFADTLELTRSWESCAAAVAGVSALQAQVLALPPAALFYGSTRRGTAVCTGFDFDIFGCSASIRLAFEGTIA